MAQALLNEWEMDGPTEQLGDVIRLMERLLDGGSHRQILNGICNLLQQQVPGSRALAGLFQPQSGTLGDWHAPHLPQELLFDLDDYPLPPGSVWRERLESGQATANGDLQRDSGWELLGDALVGAGLRAGLVMPVLSGQGRLLGKIGLYWLAPHLALPREQLALKRATRLARISIEYLQRQQALINDEAAYRELAESTTVPMFVLKGELIGYVNGATTDLTGYSAAELLTQTPWHFIHPDDRKQARNLLLQAQRQASAGRCEFRLRDKTGAVTAVEAEISPIAFRGSPAILTTLRQTRPSAA